MSTFRKLIPDIEMVQPGRHDVKQRTSHTVRWMAGVDGQAWTSAHSIVCNGCTQLLSPTSLLQTWLRTAAIISERAQ